MCCSPTISILDNRLMLQSINQILYSVPSRSLLRDAPDPDNAGKNSLEMVVELRTGTVWEVLSMLGLQIAALHKEPDNMVGVANSSTRWHSDLSQAIIPINDSNAMA